MLFRSLMCLTLARYGISWGVIGSMMAVYDEALRYLGSRTQFDKPLSAFQAIQFYLADMSTEIDAARLLTWKAAWAKASGRRYTLEAAQAKLGDANTVFVDIRDVRELERDGMIPGAFHAPRGMLEFWVDPESKYYKPVFVPGKTYILYCAADWRATLAAGVLAEMGMQDVLHLEGHDVTRLPLRERKKLLKRALSFGGTSGSPRTAQARARRT